MSTDYTHLTKLSCDSVVAIGADGSEVDVISSARAVTATSLVNSGPSSNAKVDIAATATVTALASSTGFVKITGTLASTIAGITAGVDGQLLDVYCSGGGTITFSHQNTLAAAAARIITMTGGNVATTAVGFASLRYDSGASRWIHRFVTA